ICDNCLTYKKKKTGNKHFEEIEARLKVATEKNINKLIPTLAPHSSHTVWEVLYYLQSENKLIINDDGDMEWN
ncbi:hypothetical protein ACI4BF_28900, partial [Klebsiella pneumoniae]|uniref:hypothetical protein n=1 Tax=Klebsiella pneumoniae TaxID=573 RepID=UPI003853A5F9